MTEQSPERPWDPCRATEEAGDLGLWPAWTSFLVVSPPCSPNTRSSRARPLRLPTCTPLRPKPFSLNGIHAKPKLIAVLSALGEMQKYGLSVCQATKQLCALLPALLAVTREKGWDKGQETGPSLQRWLWASLRSPVVTVLISESAFLTQTVGCKFW